MPVYALNPLEDPRWEDLVQRDRRASVFHTTGWLKALFRVYGYQPVVYTTSPPGDTLRNGMVFCRVDSLLTGRRLVSLPFSDHCEPLVQSVEEQREILTFLHRLLEENEFRHVEIRPLSLDLTAEPRMQIGAFYCFHELDLRPSREDLLRGCNKKSVQAKLRKAASGPLTVEEGWSDEILKKFYHLMVMTRRRHNLPPPPQEWFWNLAALLGDRLLVRVVSLSGQPVASILTLSHQTTLIYKYGCSDSRYHHLGGMPFLIWKAIETAKQHGFEKFDLGRSDFSNEGLIKFKDHFGAVWSVLNYARMSAQPASKVMDGSTKRFAKHIFAHMPGRLLALSGRLLYRHIG